MFFNSFFRKNQNPDKCRKPSNDIEIRYIQVIWFLESHGCQELQGVTEKYRGLQRVKKDYKGLQRVTSERERFQSWVNPSKKLENFSIMIKWHFHSLKSLPSF